MKDKEKQIEEMAKELAKRDCYFYDKCNRKPKHNCISLDPKIRLDSDKNYVIIATWLINAGYRKLPKDSVVLSREEYKMLLEEARKAKNQCIKIELETIIKAEDQARKETAEKIFKELKTRLKDCPEVIEEGYNVQNSVDYFEDIIGYDKFCADEIIKKLAKQFGNELESENERLNKSDTSKEESSIEYYNLYKDLKRKNKDLNELCELQRVSIAENFVRENQLKDQIAEMEKSKFCVNCTKEIQGREVVCFDCHEEVIKCAYKQFAERLIEKAKKGSYIDKRSHANLTDFIIDIDETLKEFIND